MKYSFKTYTCLFLLKLIVKLFFLIVPFILSINVNADLNTKELHILNSDQTSLKFIVEIADNNESRSKGLMWRKTLPLGTGMFFVWEDEKNRSFWMKNTPLSLDILFFDKDGLFINSEINAKPFSTKKIMSSKPSKFVLEILGGSSKLFNIYENSRIIEIID